MLDRMLQNVRVCARLTRRRSSDVVWNQMLVRSGYQVARDVHTADERIVIEALRLAPLGFQEA
jgi:hypothetical protein